MHATEPNIVGHASGIVYYSLCQAKRRGLDLLQEVPVGLSVLDTSNGHLLLDLGQVLRLVGVKVSGRHDAASVGVCERG